MTYIPAELRRFVHGRTDGCCEYCLLGEHFTYFTYEIDHVYAEKHGGETIENNLCLSCSDCNRHKGSDLCSLDPETGDVVTLFHPRRDKWVEHFRLNGAQIEGISPHGRVTVRLLQMNDPDRYIERVTLIVLGRYPGGISDTDE